MLREQFQKLFFSSELVGLDGFVEARERCFYLLGKLLVDMPACAEVVVFAAGVEHGSDGEKKKEVVALRLIFRKRLQDGLLRKYRTERCDLGLEIFPILCEGGVCIRIEYRRDAVVFYLTDAFARNPVFLSDGVESTALTLSGKPKAVSKHAARALR